MSKEVKVRVVRCYGCLKLLPEMPEHSIYRCANCGAVIQAKNSRTSSVDSETESPTSVKQQGVRESSETAQQKDSCEEMSVSEGPFTSSEIASEYSLNRKGKGKLIEGHVENEGRSFHETNYFQFSDSMGGSKDVPSDSHVSLYLSSSDQEELDYDAPSFRRNVRFDKSAADPHLKLKTRSPSPASYYGNQSNESCHDGGDDQKWDKSSWRLRKDKEVEFKSTRSILNDAPNVRSYRSRGRGGMRSPYNQGDVSSLPFDPRDSFPERVSSAQGFNSSENVKQLEELNQMELRRTIQELEDKLKGISKFPLHRNLLAEDHNPPSLHYDHLRPVQRETYSDHGDHNYLLRHGGLRDLTPYDHQACSSRSHCYHEDGHCPSQMPLHIKSRPHCFNGYDISHPVSREDSLGGIATNLEEEIKRLNLKKTSQTVKKALLPVGGGAPFVACRFCWEPLELPSSFISFKRGHDKLRCGACKKILRF